MDPNQNILRAVQTWQPSNLALLQNQYCFMNLCNAKFKDFEKLTGNLGSTVTFDQPPQITTRNSLQAQFQGIYQPLLSLTVDKEISSAYVFDASQLIYNIDPENYEPVAAKSAITSIATKVEKDIANVCVQETYRFYGNGIDPINSFNQISDALARFRNMGTAWSDFRCVLSDLAQSAIAASGLNQFALARNDVIAQKWEVGNYNDCEFFISNLLPKHIAGTVGQTQAVMTVVSTVEDSNGGVIQMTLSGGPASDPDAMKRYDKGVFLDIDGFDPLRFLTEFGYEETSSPVQFRVEADTDSNGGGEVTISIFPALQAQAGTLQNINGQIQPGMQVKFLPNHKAGIIMSGDPLFLAMPRLPPTVPFPSSSETDPETGISLRMYYGYVFPENKYGFIHDGIWGKKLASKYAMALIFTVNQ